MSLILIIEDNEQNLYLEKYLLEKNGYSVEFANNGFEGIKKLENIFPDLILLDIQLPEIDGYEVARRIRKLERHKNTPIIAVTSYAMVGDKEKALESGCNGYIEKPINPDTFILEIQKFKR
ncbi:MAG: response regulator [Exilispira sp.]|jgi:CheY-like chemotaxis protein|nr:response regulator [Exilispira sp.]